MMSQNNPMRFGSEVESAVIQTGLPDFQMAHGAGLVTDQSRFRPVVPHEPAPRQVFGVTATSLNSYRDLTFRTATFGISDPAFISQLDALGTSAVVDIGAQTDCSPRSTALMSSRFVLGILYDELVDHGQCTLGGIIMHSSDVRGNVQTTPFIAENFADYLEKQFSTRRMKVSESIYSIVSSKGRLAKKRSAEPGALDAVSKKMLGAYGMYTANAVRRDGPVVVERPLVAQI